MSRKKVRRNGHNSHMSSVPSLEEWLRENSSGNKKTTESQSQASSGAAS